MVQSDAAWLGYMRLGSESTLLVAVVDGMGGHRGGIVASRMVAEHFSGVAPSLEPSDTVATLLVQEANKSLFSHASMHVELCGMGATVAAVWFGFDAGLSFNVGDAKVFRVQDGFLQLRGEEHAIQAADGRRSLLRSIGGTNELRPPVPSHSVERVRSGRQFLLCTDGLTDEVDLDRIEQCMALAPEHAVTALVEAARPAGGRDNITLAIVELAMEDQA